MYSVELVNYRLNDNAVATPAVPYPRSFVSKVRSTVSHWRGCYIS